MTTTVLLAGATGMLGAHIADHLLDQFEERNADRPVEVRLMVRSSAWQDAGKAASLNALKARGATIVEGDVRDPSSLDVALRGVDVVVSALQGREDVMLDGQVNLAKAAVEAGAHRFIPSNFAIDLFAAPVGAPQFDVRRAADEAIDAMPINTVHVLNGAFMDQMLDPAQPGMIDVSSGTAMLFGTGDEPFDLTTVDDTARFTAYLATDPTDVSGVRYISGSRSTFNEIFAETEAISGQPLTVNPVGGVDTLRSTTAQAEDPWSVVPQWYMLSMLTVPAFPHSDDHYPGSPATTLHDYLTGAHAALARS